jgi:hypothetical protein
MVPILFKTITPHPPTNTNMNKKIPGRPGYWQTMWRTRRENMTEHLAKLNERRVEKTQEKIRLVKALIPQLPTCPMNSTQLREAVREAFNLSYGEELDSPQAWNLVRASRRAGIIKPDEDGLYRLNNQ